MSQAESVETVEKVETVQTANDVVVVDKCAICLETIEESCATLECGHTFHATCISDWFRSQHITCPECRGVPTKCLSKKCATIRFKELQKIMRRKNPPKELAKAFKAYNKKTKAHAQRKAKRKALRQEVKELAKHPKVKEYLSKKRRTGWEVEFRDQVNMENLRYTIGATDFPGVHIRAITERPMVLAQTIEFENGTRYTIS